MSFFSSLKKFFFGSQIDEPVEKQKNDPLLAMLIKAGLPVGNLSEGCDEIPGSHGEFGRTPSNPIPVNHIIGEFAYLNRLRSPDGTSFLFHRKGSTKVSSNKNNIDVYELVSVDGKYWETLYFDMYYTYRSKKAPNGLSLIHWSELNDVMLKMIKFPMCGTNSFVQNFPFDLPQAIAKDAMLEMFMPGTGNIIAERIHNMLSKKPRELWIRTKICQDNNYETKEYSDEELIALSKNGHPEAQYMLANKYYMERSQSQKNIEEAINLYHKSAENGYAKAQGKLAFIYFTGDDCQRNHDLAFKFSEKAAKQGHMIGQYVLGMSYLSGKGTVQDIDLAIYWLTKAAEQGSPVGCLALVSIYEGFPGHHNPKLAKYHNQELAEYWKAQQHLIWRNPNNFLNSLG